MLCLTLFVILWKCFSVLACPRSCTCSEKVKLVNCANGGFTHLPRGVRGNEWESHGLDRFFVRPYSVIRAWISGYRRKGGLDFLPPFWLSVRKHSIRVHISVLATRVCHPTARTCMCSRGLPKFSLLTSLTTFIFASLWWVSHTGWIGPFALHIDIAVSYNERSWSGQKNSQLLWLFLLQSQNFPFLVETADAGNPCKHSIAVNYGNDTVRCAIRTYVLSLKPVCC
jgi:hypothetical protein